MCCMHRDTLLVLTIKLSQTALTRYDLATSRSPPVLYEKAVCSLVPYIALMMRAQGLSKIESHVDAADSKKNSLRTATGHL
jgi:hypothetical protein